MEIAKPTSINNGYEFHETYQLHATIDQDATTYKLQFK
jgi:hypothetical protein